MPGPLAKAHEVRALFGGRPVAIEFDGGVDAKSAPACREAGGDILVAGTAIFGAGSAEGYRDAIRALRGN